MAVCDHLLKLAEQKIENAEVIAYILLLFTGCLFLKVFMSASRFFACPKKSNKRKGTTLTNHKLGLVAQATAIIADQLMVRTQRGHPPTDDRRENELMAKIVAKFLIIPPTL